MAERTPNFEIEFKATIAFNGSTSEFENLMNGLVKLQEGGLMIDTTPPLENPNRGIMIDTVPVPELENGGLMIGTWPTPESKSSTIMIDTVPLPEKTLGGIPAIAKLLNKEVLDKLSQGMPKIKLIRDIYGGMRNAHFHIGNEVVLLDRARFKELVGRVAESMAKGFAE